MARSRLVKPRMVPLANRRLAVDVLRRADLSDIRLCQCAIACRPFDGMAAVREVHLQVSSVAKPELENRRLVVKSDFSLHGKVADDERGLSLTFSLQLIYAMSNFDGLDEKNYDAFVHWIGLNNAWPYARQFVQDMTARVGLHPLKLPLYKAESHNGGLPSE